MSYPILINYSKEETKKIHKYLIIGFYITIPFVIFELGFDIQIVNLFSERLEPTRSIYEGINRIRATFTEPSYYAIYLCSLLYIFTNSKKPPKNHVILMIVICIILTFSFGGYLLALFIAFKTLRKKIKNLYIYFLLGFGIFVFNPLIFQILLYRLNLTIISLITGNYYGSEGSRVNSIIIMFEYFSTGVKEFLFGEGFTYYSNWLIERFGHDELYQFSDGQIFNTFASVGISTGAIGLFIYLIFLNSLRKSIYFNNMDILFFIMIHFLFSGLQGYFLWSVMILIKLNKTKNIYL